MSLMKSGSLPMPTEELFSQLKLQFIDPIQRGYEVARPIVLFSQSVADRSREAAAFWMQSF